MISLSGRCYGWSKVTTPWPRNKLSAAERPLSHLDLTLLFIGAACTATIPGLDIGKETAIPYEMEGLSASARLFEVLPTVRVSNLTALRADFAYEYYEAAADNGQRVARSL